MVAAVKIFTLFIFVLVFSSLMSPNLVRAVDLPAQALNHIPVCPPGNPDTPRCHARVVVDKGGKPQSSTSPTGLSPAQFLAAYNLTGSVVSARTIAIVDAYDDPNTLSDLNTYSATFGIPTLASCTVSTGTPTSPCFQKVDQRGGTAYPPLNSGWSLEMALDVETAHALCQNCNILLVEADSNSYANLMAGVDRAVNMGAKFVSNSYGSSEFLTETSFDSHFAIPGVAFTFSTGDNGFGAEYPASSRYVTAVGGTTLNMSGNSYLGESAWNGAGSGCSSFEPKPFWQKDTGCFRRMVADVSADADPNTGASVYDTISYSGQTGWFQVGGTSLSSPIIAATYALAGDVPAGTFANSLPYSKLNYGVTLRDVLTGNNGRCRRNPPYFCNAVTGYDGPTGLGTPLTPAAF